MNSSVLFPVIAGLVVMISIPILLIIIPLKWADHIPISRANFWIAAIFSIIPIFGYVVLAVSGLAKTSGVLFGNLLFCMIGGLIGTVAALLNGPLRDYYAKSWTSLAESRKNKPNDSGVDRPSE